MKHPINTTKLRDLAQKKPEEVLRELMQENKRLLKIEKAARNLAKVKGRHNSMIAMHKLLKALK